MSERKGWYRRSRIPHIDAAHGVQFVTWRLWDSVPKDVVAGWKRELARLPEGRAERELQMRIEEYANAGHGCCLLRNTVAALTVQNAILRHHEVNCTFLAWCVMPNHVHALFLDSGALALGELVGQMKGASSREINRRLGRSGLLWEPDYFDRLMRDDGHKDRTLRYIEWNPVKAGLCTDPMQWAFSSASKMNQVRLKGSAG